MIRDSIDAGRAPRERGVRMALPVVAAALLAGCVTSDYRYREDHGGGYYYGTPSVEYRERNPYPYPYGAYPYGAYGPYGPYGAYGPYNPYGWSYPYWPRPPYGGYSPYYGHYGHGPYGGYPYRYVVPRRAVTPRTDPTPDRPRSPWRDLDHLRRPRTQPPGGATQSPAVPPPPAVMPTTPRGSSGLGERIRRAKERASVREDTP